MDGVGRTSSACQLTYRWEGPDACTEYMVGDGGRHRVPAHASVVGDRLLLADRRLDREHEGLALALRVPERLERLEGVVPPAAGDEPARRLREHERG